MYACVRAPNGPAAEEAPGLVRSRHGHGVSNQGYVGKDDVHTHLATAATTAASSAVTAAAFASTAGTAQTIEVPVAEMEPFVFGVIRRKDKKALLQVAKDLVTTHALFLLTCATVVALIVCVCICSRTGGLLPCAADNQAA